MPLRFLTLLLLVCSAAASAQSQPAMSSFEAVSIRPIQREVGPDSNNQLTYSPDAFTGRNVTLKRLIAEAWHCQLKQVSGPQWIDHLEYDVEARVPQGATREQTRLMLRALLADRFQLKQHSESKSMRVYELKTGKNGPRIKPVQDGSSSSSESGFHFRGDMRQFADLLTVQFSIPSSSDPSVPAIGLGPQIPVIDKTGLQGTYEFSADIKPELNTDGFTAWSRILEDQLGLKIDSKTEGVPMIVVDEVLKLPTAN